LKLFDISFIFLRRWASDLPLLRTYHSYWVDLGADPGGRCGTSGTSLLPVGTGICHALRQYKGSRHSPRICETHVSDSSSVSLVQAPHGRLGHWHRQRCVRAADRAAQVQIQLQQEGFRGNRPSNSQSRGRRQYSCANRSVLHINRTVLFFQRIISYSRRFRTTGHPKKSKKKSKKIYEIRNIDLFYNFQARATRNFENKQRSLRGPLQRTGNQSASMKTINVNASATQPRQKRSLRNTS